MVARIKGSVGKINMDEKFKKSMKTNQNPDIIELGLCEYPHLYLRPDQLYRFIVMPDCEKCKALAEEAKLPNEK